MRHRLMLLSRVMMWCWKLVGGTGEGKFFYPYNLTNGKKRSNVRSVQYLFSFNQWPGGHAQSAPDACTLCMSRLSAPGCHPVAKVEGSRTLNICWLNGCQRTLLPRDYNQRININYPHWNKRSRGVKDFLLEKQGQKKSSCKLWMRQDLFFARICSIYLSIHSLSHFCECGIIRISCTIFA